MNDLTFAIRQNVLVSDSSSGSGCHFLTSWLRGESLHSLSLEPTPRSHRRSNRARPDGRASAQPLGDGFFPRVPYYHLRCHHNLEPTLRLRPVV